MTYHYIFLVKCLRRGSIQQITHAFYFGNHFNFMNLICHTKLSKIFIPSETILPVFFFIRPHYFLHLENYTIGTFFPLLARMSVTKIFLRDPSVARIIYL